MKISVDKNLCIGCSTCVALCSEGFKIDNEGKAEATSQENIDCAKNAAESCPVQAILIK